MNEYLWLKTVHIFSALLLFGTGIGSAFYKFVTDRSGNLPAIAVTNRHVVWADWLFTTPTVIIQPITGIWMALLAGWPLTSGWIKWTLILYVLVGLCWLPVVYLQIAMQHMAEKAIAADTTLPPIYSRLMRIWFWLGILAFIMMLAIIYLMVFKPYRVGWLIS
ncbi:MAG: DUF2269 domain-containing protein [Thioploca sp.]|nr:DUF2269 domain-containing protein [Thioploca sp.]